jgi:hypothetical protein
VSAPARCGGSFSAILGVDHTSIEETEMTALTAPALRFTHSGRTALWLSVIALTAAGLALTVWLVVRVTSTTSSTPAPAHKAPAQHSQNQLCAPAPGTRFC